MQCPQCEGNVVFGGFDNDADKVRNVRRRGLWGGDVQCPHCSAWIRRSRSSTILFNILVLACTSAFFVGAQTGEMLLLAAPIVVIFLAGRIRMGQRWIVSETPELT